MAVPYSTQLVSGNFGNNALLYTVPSGSIAVLRSISVYCLNTGLLGALGLTTAGPWVMVRTSPTPNATIEWYGRHVLNPNQQLYLVTGGASAYVLVSGYLLSQA